MMNLQMSGGEFHARRMLSILVLAACLSNGVLAANDITGSARNLTLRRPAAGDEVILVRLDHGMQEEARTRTDAQGAFTLHVQYPEAAYLVRVVQQHVNYDQRASAGDSLSIQVFDAARQVRGVIGSIEILRAGTNGKLLHVSDMYEIKNESSPPVTQAGERTFEVYLPKGAKIVSVLAAGPGKIGESIDAAPVPGEPGHYAVNFPLRPGATKFAFNYDLPYEGHAAFQTNRAYPFQQLAVMIPLTMKFTSRSSAFQVLDAGNGKYQVRTASQLKAGKGPGFDVFGTGTLPALGDQAKSQVPSESPAQPQPTASGAGHAVLSSLAHLDPRLEQAHSSSQALVLGGVSAVLLVGCALLVWRARKTPDTLGAKPAPPQAGQTQWSSILLESVRKELFQVEEARGRGSISGEEYASTKQALEEILKLVAEKSRQSVAAKR